MTDHRIGTQEERQAPVCSSIADTLTGRVSFARRAGETCGSTRLWGTLTLRLGVQSV